MGAEVAGDGGPSGVSMALCSAYLTGLVEQYGMALWVGQGSSHQCFTQIVARLMCWKVEEWVV